MFLAPQKVVGETALDEPFSTSFHSFFFSFFHPFPSPYTFIPSLSSSSGYVGYSPVWIQQDHASLTPEIYSFGIRSRGRRLPSLQAALSSLVLFFERRRVLTRYHGDSIVSTNLYATRLA